MHLKGLTKRTGTSLRQSGPLWLNLHNTQVTDAGLVHLKGLTKLKKALPKCNIVHSSQNKSRNQPSQLPRKPNQQKPATAGKKESVAELEKLGARFKRDTLGEIMEISLSGTPVTDAGLVHLKGLTKLETLWLGSTQITDGGLIHLTGLTKLKNLGLWDASVTDAGLVQLKGLTKLERLNLEGTQITDAGLEHLTGLTKLETLWLDDTQVTDTGVAELKKALPKCYIQM